jgi:choline dehydrogenase-like flavoprotein
MDWGNHHLGTTRMSNDPRQGVVDADCKVHDVDNLYIASSSVFPTYSASNPTLNLIALTLRLGDHLKKVMV